MKEVPRLRVFAGPNGSGKSTLYNEFSKLYDTGILVNSDEIELKFQKHSHINLADFNLNLSSNDWATFINSPISESLLQKSGIEDNSLKLKYENNIISIESSIVNS